MRLFLAALLAHAADSLVLPTTRHIYVPLSARNFAAPRSSLAYTLMLEEAKVPEYSFPTPAAVKLATISDENFEDEVLGYTDGPVILDFFEDWCGPCKLIEPLLTDLHKTGEVKVVKAKPGTSVKMLKWLKKHGSTFRVGALPHVILVENGKPARSLVGRFDSKRLDAFVGDVVKGLRGVVQPAPAPQQIPIPVHVGASPPPSF